MDTTPRRAALAALVVLLSVGHAAAQQLIAWPMGHGPWTQLLPGTPVRPMPLPPRPILRPPFPQPRPIPPAPLAETSPVSVSGYTVEGEVRDDAADLTYDIVFHNPTSQRLEGVLLVPIPADAVLSGFQMTAGGKTTKGELLESGQAATIYENIVRQMRDPGLLELVGERLFRARVFPIEPGADITVRLTLSEVLHKTGGLASLRVPVRAPLTPGERRAASVRLRLSTTRPLRTVYSPDARLRITRSGERAAEATLDAAEGDGDVALYFSTQDDPLAAGVLAFRESGEDGYFMASLSPRAATPQAQGAPKDLVFVVDRSGSMEESGKIEQARAALSYCVRRLSPRDRFGIVDFATDWSELEPRLLPATEENKARALRYIERLEASGGTNIEGGLTEGLRLLAHEEGRVPLLFFMTDGLPTVGQTDVDSLLRAAQERNRALRARLFTFGVGSDVNTLLLDKLAQENRGSGDYVQPGESIEAKVSALYQKVARPALTDVRLEWQGVDVVQVFPQPVGDLFHGSDLVVLGRYKAGGRGRLVVTGSAAGRPQRFEFPVELPAGGTPMAFLPRLWASAKVSHELDAIRLSGGNPPQEVVAEIVRLAKRYGIVTPYTSYLVTEEGRDERRAREITVAATRGMAFDAAASGTSQGGAGLSLRAQNTSRLFQAMAKSAAAPVEAAAAITGAAVEAQQEAEQRGERIVERRTVGDKTFYRRDGVWVDGDSEAEGARVDRRVEVSFASPEYFELIRARPELARYLAVGAPLRLLRDGVLYEVKGI